MTAPSLSQDRKDRFVPNALHSCLISLYDQLIYCNTFHSLRRKHAAIDGIREAEDPKRAGRQS